MPAFDIYYLDGAGDVACAFSVRFENPLRAKILAHAMKPAECREMEVWESGTLIYRRPENVSIDPALATASATALMANVVR